MLFFSFYRYPQKEVNGIVYPNEPSALLASGSVKGHFSPFLLVNQTCDRSSDVSFAETLSCIDESVILHDFVENCGTLIEEGLPKSGCFLLREATLSRVSSEGQRKLLLDIRWEEFRERESNIALDLT